MNRLQNRKNVQHRNMGTIKRMQIYDIMGCNIGDSIIWLIQRISLYNKNKVWQKMSEYDDQDQLQFNDYEAEKPKQIFHYDTSLLTSVQSINNWKLSIGLPVLEYLKKEEEVVSKQYQLFSCGNQIRAVAFCKMLDRGFEQLCRKYVAVYARVNQENQDIVADIRQLDSQLEKLIRYLQLVQANNVTSLYTEIQKYQSGIADMYSNVRKLTDFCLDLNTLWLTLLTPRMFREELKQNLYKVNYGGTQLYYHKQLSYLLQRIKRAQIHNFSLQPKSQKELLQNIAIILNNTKLKQNLKTKIVSLLKGQFYNRIEMKSMKEEFILASLEMYNGEEVSEVWDYQRYQNVCIQALKRSFVDDQYIDCALYMEPENIHFQHRKRTLQFAEIYYSLVTKILSINKNIEKEKQPQVLPLVEIPIQFIHKLLYGQNIQLFGHLLVNFLISNKNAFSQNSPNLDSMLFGILEAMRQIYLSFGLQNWYVPTAALAALTNKFFTKFSEDIKDQIVNLLPFMVKHLGEDKLPVRPHVTYVQSSKQYKLTMKQVSRSQMLMAIFLYIRDAEYKDQDFYLDLPQVTPSNLQTAIMFVRSLQLKLRHHEPTQDQKKLWTILLSQSMGQYKVHTNLKWYKKQKKLDIEQRQGQFIIHKQIKQKWAFDLVQQVLNWRDQQIYDKLIEDGVYRELSLDNDIIGYFKYAINVVLDVGTVSGSLEEYDLFNFLEKMRTLLEINYGDIVHMTIDQLITLNQLHLCLKIYNTRVQSAKGNQIYMLIVTKIIIPWMQSEDKAACQDFQKSFPQFFTRYIMQEYYLLIGDSIVTLLANRSQNTENLLYKINYFIQELNRDDVVSNSLDSNAELLQKLYSVLDDAVDVKVMVSIMILLLKFLEFQPKLEDDYVSVGFFVDFICQPKRIDLFLAQIQELPYNQRLRINLEIIKKLPEKLQLLTLDQINQILRTHIDSHNDSNQPQKFIKILQTIPVQKNTLLVVILKALTAQRNKQKILQTVKDNNEAKKLEQEKAFKYWKQVEEYVNHNHIERKKGEEEVYLAKIAELFEQTVFKKLLEDYRKILHTQNKKKMSSKKTSLEKKLSQGNKKPHEDEKKMSEDEKKSHEGEKKIIEGEKKQEQIKEKLTSKEINIQDKYKQAKIWRKVVRNFGTFQDIILFGEDPLQIYGTQEDDIFDKCLKIIEQKTIQQKYLKRIIRKLPILQKCSEQVVQKIQKQNKQKLKHIQPQLLCKLIMINSRYRSKIVQQFILQNISKIPIPIKIYQDYLVLDIKRKLQSLPKNMIYEMLFDNQSVSNTRMKKIDQIFQLITYLPIRKFQNVHLKFQSKIEQNQEGENQEWETESEGNKQEAQDQETSPQIGKNKKKKSSKVEEEEQKNQQQMDEQAKMQQRHAQDNQQQIDDDDDDDDDMIDDEENSMQDEEMDSPHSKIVGMFYNEGDPNLPKYKQFITLRQQMNISFEQDYRSIQKLEQKIKADPQLQKKLLKTVDILQNQLTQKQIVQQILNKIPQNLYKILKNYGLTKQRNEQKIQNYRKQMVKMQRFIKDYMSDRDDNQGNEEDDIQINDDIYDEEDQLSEESGSVDDMFDGLGDQMLFVINEEGQLEHLNAEQLMKSHESEEQDQQRQSQQIIAAQNLQKQADDSLSLPQLKQINSKIELELTGKQLTMQEICKIIQVSIVKLFSLHSYQLKYKPVYSFYNQIINSKHGKVFIDTLLTVLRVDQLYNDEQRYKLAKKLSKSQLSLPKALGNILEIAVDLATQDSKESKQFQSITMQQVGALLPIGDQIVLKSDIPVQDNFLTLLVMYSRYHNSQHIRNKLKKVLSSLNPQNKQYKLTKSKAAVLTKHIYNNSNPSSIWINVQQRFGVKIDYKTKSYSCLTVYGQLLRVDVEKCYKDLLEIVKIPIQFHNEDEKKKARLLIKQQEKKVEQNLRKHFKRIKHYYYWNKKLLNQLSQIQNQEQKTADLLKNKPLVKLTELMIFYCHFLKQKFFKRIDANSMKNLLVLPKSIIEISFLYLWKMQAKIDKWQPLNKVKLYFENFKLYQHKFNSLQQVCNLMLEFLQMPEFSNSKFKQVIIPYLINNPEMANDIPLIFKLPDIPEELNGQKVYLTRQCSFDMSFYQLVAKSILVEFHNQEGSDHGGMVREFMMGWKGIGIGEEFIFLGKILAISFRKSIPFGGDFDLPMAVAITQHKVTIQFLAQVEPQVAKSLAYVRDNDPEGLQMRFQITRQKNGVIKHYPLIPNGQQTVVTNQNKSQFLKLFLQKYFIIDREWEMSEICTGFYSIVNKKYAAIFNPFELIQKIQGEQISDYTKLKNKTKYQQGYTESSQMIRWFWEIVSEFNQPQMNKFLQFITGAPKVSIYNHNFSFVIEKPYGQDETRLPVAHTCFNTLELPEYKTKQILQKKLNQAIYEGNDSFGIL